MCRTRLRGGAALLTAGLLIGGPTLHAQEISEPLPSTPNPAGSVLPPDEADGVPDEDGEVEVIERPARPQIEVPDRNTERRPGVATPPSQMTAEDVQTWQQIATLHERFVRSQLPGSAAEGAISRTDPNRERLRRLWERLADIERQLIISGAVSEEIADDVVVRVRRVPRRDLDEVPDPLTASNQRVKASENDEDQQTARALAQEDRSPPPDPVIRGETIRDADPRDPLTAEAIEDAVEERVDVDVVEDADPDTGSLWREFVEVRRQILMTEIAAARAVDKD